MIPGTSHKITISLPFNTIRVSDFQVKITQNDKLVIKKEKEDCEFNRNKVRLELTPEETAKFNPFWKFAKIQAEGKTNTGRTFKTEVERFPVEESL